MSPRPQPIYRAPMRARHQEVAPGLGADHGVAHDLVGIGDALDQPPPTLEAALVAVVDAHGEKAGRMLHRFADLPDGTFVWTRTSDGCYRLGRIAGPYRYDDSPQAHEVGVHHVRPANWLGRAFGDDEVPDAVASTFARGGRNLQRTNDADAERATAELWAAQRSAD